MHNIDKAVLLCGGAGTRLLPMTKVTNKHLLPVYDKPMVYYPLCFLKKLGVKEVLLITGPEHAGDFINTLGDGEEFSINLSYSLQKRPDGIAGALKLAERFVGDSNFICLLGDNYFEYEDAFSNALETFRRESQLRNDGEEIAAIFIKEVANAQRFGVVEVKDNVVISIEEKPSNPKTNLAQTGLYIYTPDVFKKLKRLKPSARGELEVSDLNESYIENSRLFCIEVNKEWIDMGTVDSLLDAANFIRGAYGKTEETKM